MLVVHRPKTSCTYFPEASLCHRPTDHRQEQFSILKYEEVLIFCHATLPTTMRVVLRVSIHIFSSFFVIIFVISRYARSSYGMCLSKHCDSPFQAFFLKTHSFARISTMPIGNPTTWLVRVHPGCPHKKIDPDH